MIDVFIKVAIIDICFPAVPLSVSSVFSFYDLKLYCSCSISQNSTVMFLTTEASVKLNGGAERKAKKKLILEAFCRKFQKTKSSDKKRKRRIRSLWLFEVSNI